MWKCDFPRTWSKYDTLRWVSWPRWLMTTRRLLSNSAVGLVLRLQFMQILWKKWKILSSESEFKQKWNAITEIGLFEFQDDLMGMNDSFHRLLTSDRIIAGIMKSIEQKIGILVGFIFKTFKSLKWNLLFKLRWREREKDRQKKLYL